MRPYSASSARGRAVVTRPAPIQTTHLMSHPHCPMSPTNPLAEFWLPASPMMPMLSPYSPPMSPIRLPPPTSPLSPVKAAIHRFYPPPVKTTYMLRAPASPTARTAAAPSPAHLPVSPGTAADHQASVLEHFRRARDANAKYIAYKESEAQKKAIIRSKSLPVQQTAMDRLQRARARIRAVVSLGVPRNSQVDAGVVVGRGPALLARLNSQRIAALEAEARNVGK